MAHPRFRATPPGGGPAGVVGSARPRRIEVVDAELRQAPGVAVRGEIDLATVPCLERALDTAIRASHGAFVLDLSDVEFLDSTGLHALLRARALLGREDRALAIVCPPGPVRRLFDVAGVADLLFLYASREDAAAALVPPDAHGPGRSTPGAMRP
jgi:anti-sigma B factor antagonist